MKTAKPSHLLSAGITQNWILFALETKKFTVETSIFQIVGIRVVLQQLRMGPSRESAQGAGAHLGVESRRATHETELVEAFILAFAPVGGHHLLDVGARQFQLLPGMSLEDVAPVWAVPLEPVC